MWTEVPGTAPHASRADALRVICQRAASSTCQKQYPQDALMASTTQGATPASDALTHGTRRKVCTMGKEKCTASSARPPTDHRSVDNLRKPTHLNSEGGSRQVYCESVAHIRCPIGRSSAQDEGRSVWGHCEHDHVLRLNRKRVVASISNIEAPHGWASSDIVALQGHEAQEKTRKKSAARLAAPTPAQHPH